MLEALGSGALGAFDGKYHVEVSPITSAEIRKGSFTAVKLGPGRLMATIVTAGQLWNRILITMDKDAIESDCIILECQIAGYESGKEEARLRTSCSLSMRVSVDSAGQPTRETMP